MRVDARRAGRNRATVLYPLLRRESERRATRGDPHVWSALVRVTGYVRISEAERDTERPVLGKTGPGVGRKPYHTTRSQGRSRLQSNPCAFSQALLRGSQASTLPLAPI